MITMKKKVLVAMAMAAAMVAMPVVAGAAGSPSQSESDGTIGNDSSSSSSSSNNTVSNSGNTENQNTPGVASGATKEAEKTVVQGANNERVEVFGTTKDSKGTTVGLVGNDAGKGSVSSDNGASVSIATGAAETAGLSASAVNEIKSLNSGKAPSEVIPNSGLEDYASVGGTRAIVSKNAAGQDVSTNVTLYVDALTAGKEVAVAYYDNNTGLWIVVKNVTFNASTKTVSFAVPGSCTVQVVAK